MAGDARERLLDVSELEPCEPMERVLAAVRELVPGEYLRMLHRQEPRPLYPLLERLGMAWYGRAGERTAFELLIFASGDPVARAAVAAQAAADGRALPEVPPN